MSEGAGAPPGGGASRAGIGVALGAVAIDAMGIGIIFPVMPDLLLSLGLDSVSEAALWGGLLTTLYALMQFLCAPALGNLSDRFGRRPVMVWGMAAMAVDYVILSFAGGLWILLVGRAVAGAAGATYATATAYVADLTPPAERAARFGLIGATFGLGFVLGPALGGLVGEWHVRAPFMLAAALAGANCLLAMVALRESLLPALRWLLAGYLLFGIGNHVYPSVWAFWGKATFGWSVGVIGLSLAAYGTIMAIVQGWLIRPSVAWLGEPRTIIVGLVLGALGAVGFGFVGSGAMAFALLPVVAFSDIATPALSGMMANRVGDDEQGELQGILVSLMAVAAVITPPLATGLFYHFTAPGAPLALPGAPFLLSAVLVALAIPLMWRSLFAPPPGAGG